MVASPVVRFVPESWTVAAADRAIDPDCVWVWGGGRYWTDEVRAIEPSSSIKFGEDERFVVSYDEQISKL